MTNFNDAPSRDEALRRHIRDYAVHEAMGAHQGVLRESDADQRLVNEIAQLAVHTALLRYSAEMAMQISRIESYERMRYDEAMLRPSPTMLQAMIDMASPKRSAG